MLIPGQIVTLLTFPGVIVHEAAHRLVCNLLGVRVLKVCYFRFGNPAGYVAHEQPDNAIQQILIGIGPFIVNSIIGAIIAFPGALADLSSKASIAHYVLIWLGVSIAMHSFPSTGDAKSIWRAMWMQGTPFLVRLAALPVILIIYLGAIGSFFWLDLIYGVGVAFYLPRYLLSLWK